MPTYVCQSQVLSNRVCPSCCVARESSREQRRPRDDGTFQNLWKGHIEPSAVRKCTIERCRKYAVLCAQTPRSYSCADHVGALLVDSKCSPGLGISSQAVHDTLLNSGLEPVKQPRLPQRAMESGRHTVLDRRPSCGRASERQVPVNYHNRG